MAVNTNLLLPEINSVQIKDDIISNSPIHEIDARLGDEIIGCETINNISDIELRDYIINKEISQCESSTVNNLKAEPLVEVYISVPNNKIKIEDEITADNNKFLFCIHCEEYYQDYCIKCRMLLYILNNINNETRKEIPKDILEIRESFEHLGIFSLKVIPVGVKFGPFIGLKTSTCSWKTKRGKFIVSEDNLKRLNWMGYINHARHTLEYNLLVFQHANNIYYRVIREIRRGDELLVYFGEVCDDNLHNDEVEVDFIPTLEKDIEDVFACTFCCLGFSSIDYLITHKTVCLYGTIGNSSSKEIMQCPYCKIYLEQGEYAEYHNTYCREKNDRWSVVSSQNHSMVVSRKRNRCQRKIFKCLQCNYETYYNAVLKEHTNGHYEVKVYRCQICYGRFKRLKHFKIHMSKIHAKVENKETLCRSLWVCETSSKSQAEEVEHCGKGKYKCTKQNYERNPQIYLKTSFGRNLFKCTKCNYRRRLKDSVKKHVCTYVVMKRKWVNRDKVINLKSNHEENSYTYESDDVVTNVKSNFERDLHTRGAVKRFRCSKCDYASRFKANLQRHSYTHDIEKLFKCSQCDYATNSKGSLERHSYTHEAVKRFKCLKCDYATNMKCDFRNHSYAHETVKRFFCSKCDYATNFKRNLQRHSYTHEAMKRFKCLKCDFATNMKSSLEGHSYTHGAEKRFKCMKCDYATNDKCGFKNHLYTHETARRFKCCNCDYATNVKYDFDKHRFTHETNKRFECSKCDYGTNFRSNLTNHSFKHESAKRFKCSKCHFETNFKSSLDRHSLVHETVKQIKCSLCDYVTNDKCNLKNHLYIHETAKPFKCFECNYESKCKDYLKKHIYTHQTVKRFKCSICDYVTNRRKDFDGHSYTHEALKQLICSKCDYATNCQSDHKKHLRTHDTVKHLKCSKCDYATNTKSRLKKHFSTHENVQ